MAAEVSHGRGGAGNINPDETKYVDGEITRTGDVGSHQDGAYSTGRGGAANIADKGSKSATRLDKESVPAEAVRNSGTVGDDYHVGRGGAGNAHRDGAGPEKTGGEKSFADKLKSLLSSLLKKKKDTPAA